MAGRMSLYVATLIATFAASSALASDPQHPTALWHARDLANLCKADTHSTEYTMCWSFIGAVFEVAWNNSIYDLKACIPPLVNGQKAVSVTVKWLSEHPEEDAMQPASLATAKALAAAFPCAN